MPDTQVRIVGGNYTVFAYKGQPLAFLERVADSGQKPLGSPYEAIYPLGEFHAKEIVTQRILGVGTLTLMIRETWNQPIWYQLSGLDGAATVADVFERLRQDPSAVTCTKIITPPSGGTPRGIQYHNCTVVGIDDGDTIDIGALSIAKNIQIVYTHQTKI